MFNIQLTSFYEKFRKTLMKTKQNWYLCEKQIHNKWKTVIIKF